MHMSEQFKYYRWHFKNQPKIFTQKYIAFNITLEKENVENWV